MPNSTPKATNPFDALIEESAKITAGAINAWASLAKELLGAEPYGTLTEGMAAAAAAWFDWAKLVQEIPLIGGGGTPPKKRVTKAGAPAIVVKQTVPQAPLAGLHATAFVDGHGNPIPPTAITVTGQPVAGNAAATEITVTVKAPAGSVAGTYHGSILDGGNRVVIQSLGVKVPAK